jgi:hypothetical protein
MYFTLPVCLRKLSVVMKRLFHVGPQRTLFLTGDCAFEMKFTTLIWRGEPCHSSGGWLLASNHGGPGLSLGKVMWDLWWTEWQCGRSSLSTSVSVYSSSITQGWYNRSNRGQHAKWTQYCPTPRIWGGQKIESK